MRRRRVCYVTGTRAEFGLMRTALEAIRDHPKLELQMIVTGMHLSAAHGRTIDQIRRDGWRVDATVPWSGGRAEATARAGAGMTEAFAELKPDVVLVCGDRVEAFAAASMAHLSGLTVAHVHGGDRALGQVDDALRHAISKLSHLHFCATRQSARRLLRMGEDRFRIHQVGTPGIDDISLKPHPLLTEPWPLVVVHPESEDERVEATRARMLLKAINAIGIRRATLIGPNNDPGWRGIDAVWRKASRARFDYLGDLRRASFLQEMANSAMLIGNSSAGIIEAASVGTYVVNVGDRQLGRERSRNVIDVPWQARAIERAVRHIWNNGRPRKFRGRNVYGGGDAGRRIARALSELVLDDRLMRKLISY